MNELVLKNRVREARVGKGLSQEELAHAVGSTRQTIISVEKGAFNPSAKLALLLTMVLERPFEELFYF